MKKIVFIIICAFTLNNCNGQKNDIVKKNNNKIDNMLKKQLEYGCPSFDNPYEYGIQDFEILLPKIKEILKSRGFKFLTNEEFNNKINVIFNRIIDPSSSSKFLCINFNDKCNRDMNYHPNDMADFYNLFVVKNENYVTESYAIPQIIDYQKEFSAISEEENQLSKMYKDEHGENVNKYFWKDDKNLSQQRQKNIEILVNRNKYLFNDNKASLTWLKFDDHYFLESLVKTFGYVKDKDLLKWVIENNRFKTESGITNGEEYGKLIWHKNCDGKFIFHKETLEIMKEEMKSKYPNYIDDLLNYIKYLSDPKEKRVLTFEEETLIIAHVLYLSAELAKNEKYQKYAYSMGSYYKFSDTQYKIDIDNEFKRNNFYNLTDFRKLWEQAKEDGDGISYPGQE